MADLMAQAAIGPEAAMTRQERTLIEQPLKRVLHQHGQVAEAVLKYSDMASLLIGLGFWATRLARLGFEQQRQVAPAAGVNPRRPTPLTPRPPGPPPPPAPVASPPPAPDAGGMTTAAAAGGSPPGSPPLEPAAVADMLASMQR